MAARERLICAASELAEQGRGVRFEVEPRAAPPAFVVRFVAEPRAFLNQCGHVPVELDWQPGEFFDDSRLYLICSTHGALYHPASGPASADAAPVAAWFLCRSSNATASVPEGNLMEEQQ
jgi:nitrite reductase/ring-hydroxylating ferredoxin subunit